MADVNAVATPKPEKVVRVRNFDAGKSSRHLRSVPTATQSINQQVQSYGRTALARARWLVKNNPHAAAAKRAFVSNLIGDGIKPTAKIKNDAPLKEAIQEAWLDWTDECDWDGLWDFYGLQSVGAGEIFTAGECFIRFINDDEAEVPLKLQMLPAEMLPIAETKDLGGGRTIRMGIEFDTSGRRVAYHFHKQHPADSTVPGGQSSELLRVPADEVLHIINADEPGQLRGVPFFLSAIATLAMVDAYEHAELVRMHTATLYVAFVIRESTEGQHQLEADGVETDDVENGIGMEPGAVLDLLPGEDVKFSNPSDVGQRYEEFMYRQLLKVAAACGVPYEAMTGDLRKTSFGSQRGGLLDFRRRIGALQHQLIVFQFCRPVRQRWMEQAVLTAVLPVTPSAFQTRRRELMRADWIPAKWAWIDPLKDAQAEALSVESGFKPRAEVCDALGFDVEEVDRRRAEDMEREKRLGLEQQPVDQSRFETDDKPDPDEKEKETDDE